MTHLLLLMSLMTPAAAAPSADEILKKYMGAVGASAIEKFQSQTRTGNLVEGAIKIPVTAVSSADGMFQATIKAPAFEVKLDGNAGKAIGPNETQTLEPGELIAVRAMIDFRFPLWVAQHSKGLHVEGKESFNNRECWRLVTAAGQEPALKMLFDAETGLLVLINEAVLSDYREGDGMKTPYNIENRKLGRSFVYTEVKNTAK